MATPTTRSSSHERDDKHDLSRPSSSGEPGYPMKHRLGDSESEGNGVVILKQSRGVTQMEALISRISTKYRILLYGGFALLAYVMSLGESQIQPCAEKRTAELTSASASSFPPSSRLPSLLQINTLLARISTRPRRRHSKPTLSSPPFVPSSRSSRPFRNLPSPRLPM